jgi:hypothetical protein
MGMYCCCGVKKREGWKCECDWENWVLCFRNNHWSDNGFPNNIPIKEIPDKDGLYEVRVFLDCGDYDEDESEFSLTKKNWGQPTNKAISHWKVEYDDGWSGFTGVYAWKEKEKNLT